MGSSLGLKVEIPHVLFKPCKQCSASIALQMLNPELLSDTMHPVFQVDSNHVCMQWFPLNHSCGLWSEAEYPPAPPRCIYTPLLSTPRDLILGRQCTQH